MKHGSLFSGVGGFDLAAEWMGWENVFHCEWNDFGKKVLKYYWPKAISYDDITKTDFTVHRGEIDILTGGFPCQPYSMAGKRKGTEDDRHLWPEMLRAIREIQPTWIVGENVSGLVNWNGGMVFNEVQADLEAAGYEVTPFLLPACGVNAPHKRERVWFVGYNKDNKWGRNNCRLGGLRLPESMEMENASKRVCFQNNSTSGKLQENNYDANAPGNTECSKRGRGGSYKPSKIRQSEGESENNKSLGEQPQQREGKRSQKTEGEEQVVCSNLCEECENSSGVFQYKGRSHECQTSGGNKSRTTTNPSDTGLQGGKINRSTGCVREKRNEQLAGCVPPTWEVFPTQSPVCDRNDGISDKLVGITFPKWRNEGIKAMGNSVVVQVVIQIFKAIKQYENESNI